MRLRFYSNEYLVDVPYDSVAVWVDGNEEKSNCYDVRIREINLLTGAYWIAGTYDSLKKANEVMRLLLKAYDAGESAFVFPKNDEVKI